MSMQQLSLNGAWTVTQVGTREEIPALVPGTIHQDLLAAQRIPDSYYRDNEQTQQWISAVGWVYRRSFIVTDELLAHDRLLLRCEGIDTLATVSINGVPVARTDNMFRTWEFDVRSLLVSGENTIAVQFDAATAYVTERQMNRVLPDWSAPWEITGRGWLRKEPCNFGWDWGPVLTTCGIWRPMHIVAFDVARLTDVYVQQDHTTPDQVTLRVTATVETARDAPLQTLVTVEYAGGSVATATGEVANGQAVAHLTIVNPHLWWPNGMGEQPLYTVHCRVQTPSGTVMDRRAQRIGLRTLSLRRTRDQWGESFQFAVNGVPFFAKGANWIPADTFAPRVTHAQYAHLLHSAVAAHMNMLRAWGGGIYEDDIFYDLCDELGICVWQDFIFACATYPTFDAAFMQNVQAEVADNLLRLRHHPAIALWCGNNEIEAGLVGEEWTARGMSWEDYTRLFDRMLPDMVTRLDPQRDYWPGSPHSPRGDRAEHNNPCWGDAHLWEVWHGKQPFEWYRTTAHRFVSEFGFQSFPEPKTVASFTVPTDRNVTSFIMEQHQRSSIGNSTILTYMLDWFQVPTTFDMTLWLSQILQGVGLQYGIEHWRRNMPRTMGTLYWQLNDCWPVASWASIDYFGRWKAPHYFAQRFYAPLLISGVEHPEHGTVEIHVTSDVTHPQPATVVWRITDTDGQPLANRQLDMEIPAQQDTLATVVDVRQLVSARGARNLLVWTELWVDGVRVSSNLHTFIRPKHVTLGDPQLRLQVAQESDTQFLVEIAAEKPALWAWLTTDGIEARYNDNFLHIRPGAPARIRVTTDEATTLEALTRDLRVFSLFDTYTDCVI
jgi:beta-mannosidase